MIYIENNKSMNITLLSTPACFNKLKIKLVKKKLKRKLKDS